MHSEKTIKEQARAIRGSFYQNCVHVNDDIHTRRNKVAWDVLIKKSKANSINILSHRSSYASAIKSYRYALHSLSQANTLRICAFMNGTKEDYLGVRSYMNVSSSSIVLNDLFIFDSEEKQTPLLTMFHSHSRYTDEDVVVYRLGKTNNNDELRLRWDNLPVLVHGRRITCGTKHKVGFLKQPIVSDSFSVVVVWTLVTL